MRYVFLCVLPLLLACGNFDRVRVGPISAPLPKPEPLPMSFHELSATDIEGNLVRMDRYEGKKVLVVNTASECGFTPQYQQLQELYDMY